MHYLHMKIRMKYVQSYPPMNNFHARLLSFGPGLSTVTLCNSSRLYAIFGKVRWTLISTEIIKLRYTLKFHNSLWLHCVLECVKQTKKVLFMVVANHQLAAAFRHRNTSTLTFKFIKLLNLSPRRKEAAYPKNISPVYIFPSSNLGLLANPLPGVYSRMLAWSK